MIVAAVEMEEMDVDVDADEGEEGDAVGDPPTRVGPAAQGAPGSSLNCAVSVVFKDSEHRPARAGE